MLKKYTATRYPVSIDEPKSPAIQHLEKAKEDLKKIEGNSKPKFINLEESKDKADFLNKMKEKFGQKAPKKVYKVKKLSELVESSQKMNQQSQKKDRKIQKMATKRLSESFSNDSSEGIVTAFIF